MIADARFHVAAALSAVGVPVHPYPPATVAPPAVVITGDTPYVTVETLATGWIVGLQVQCVVGTAGGPAAGRGLDALIETVLAALTTAGGVVAGPADAPRPEPGTAHTTAAIPITVHWIE